MKFLVDAQLPPALCRWMQAVGFEAEHVRALMAGEVADCEIAAFAIDHGWTIVTKDDDFALRHPPIRYTLVWLRIGNATNPVLIDWVAPRWAAILQSSVGSA